MAQILNQVIINKEGNSWLGLHLSGKKVDSKLKEVLATLEDFKKNQPEFKNAVWLFEKDMTCICGRKHFEDVLPFYTEDRFLVHGQSEFIFKQD